MAPSTSDQTDTPLPSVYIVLYQKRSSDALVLGVYNSLAEANGRARDHWTNEDTLKPDPSNVDGALGFRTLSGDHTWVERHVVQGLSAVETSGYSGQPWDAQVKGKLYNNDGDAQYD
jgi:hypothetical protein